MLNLYLISQTENNNYDTYDSAVVCAASEDEARQIHPNGDWKYHVWCKQPSAVTVVLIGIASADVKVGLVLASFNAG